MVTTTIVDQLLYEERRDRALRNMARCHRLSDGQLMGEEELWSLFPVEVKDENQPPWMQEQSFVPVENFRDEDLFFGRDDYGNRKLTEAIYARKKAVIQHTLEVQKIAAKILRAKLRNARTVEDLLVVDDAIYSFEDSVPRYFISRLREWLDKDFDGAEWRVGRLRVLEAAKAKRKAELEMRIDPVDLWLKDFSPIGDRQIHAWRAMSLRERKEAARCSLGLAPKRPRVASNMAGMFRILGVANDRVLAA